MELIDQLRAIAARAAEQADSLVTEEATKNALVMPFINALGYNVFDPGCSRFVLPGDCLGPSD